MSAHCAAYLRGWVTPTHSPTPPNKSRIFSGGGKQMRNPRDQTKGIISFLYRIIVPVLTLVKLIRDIIRS